VVLRESFGEVREEQVGFVTLALAVLDRLVVEERVQLDRLVRSRAVLVLTTANDTHTDLIFFHSDSPINLP